MPRFVILLSLCHVYFGIGSICWKKIEAPLTLVLGPGASIREYGMQLMKVLWGPQVPLG